MLSLKGIHKSYGVVRAVRDATFQAPRSQITAVVGPNASGKTTLMKIVLGLVRPDGGEVVWQDRPLHSRPGFQRLLGYMPQSPTFPANLTPREVVQIVAELRQENLRSFEELAEEFRLTPFWRRPIGALSLGTRQKLSAILALGVRAEILVLDEPTVNFDPAAAVVFRRRSAVRKEEGATVLVVSHLIQEVESVADRVVFVDEGQIRFSGTRTELRERTGAASLEEAVLSFFDC